MNFNFGIILAETSRSKAYLNALLKNDLKPSWILLLEDLNSNIAMPGSTKEIFEQKKDINWDEVNFDPNETILNTLKKNRLEFVAAKSNDINSKNVINLIKESEPPVPRTFFSIRTLMGTRLTSLLLYILFIFSPLKPAKI